MHESATGVLNFEDVRKHCWTLRGRAHDGNDGLRNSGIAD